VTKSKKREDLFFRVKSLLNNAKQELYRQANSAMVLTYYNIGKMIVEEEQGGKEKAGYGKEILKELSKKLTAEFGKGFSLTNLKIIRQFYLTYSIGHTVSDQFQTESSTNQKSETLSRKFDLSWSHYVFLVRLDEDERQFYEIESISNNWSVRELTRQYNTGLYQRLALSKNKEEVKLLSQKGQIIEKPADLIKEPYILEFLGLDEKASYTESDVEQEIINKIESFMLELGKGFSFVGRQRRFSFDEEHFYVDLVFYNRLLRCFILIDLKIGKLKHQDLGQMQMYVNYYDRFEKLPDENKTIGIVLCCDKKDALVEITLPEDSNIYAKKYALYLPSKNQLKDQIKEALKNNEK
jgi:predicted nuclease of restriction endonuclease-like (RecB) superfamily